MQSSQSFDVAVLGAGAAGLFCAALAGQSRRSVLLLDHASKAGKKILISGGGHCNFTNLHTQPESFLCSNPHFAKSALSRYTPADFVALVTQSNIPFHEKTLGQLFCDGSAQAIVSMLEQECTKANVRTLLRTTIASVTEIPSPQNAFATPLPRFRIETSAGIFYAQSVVVATGGLSIPKMGATDFGYRMAKQFGLDIVPTRPALVPLTLAPADRDAWCDLSGLSAEAVVSTGTPASTKHRGGVPSFREKILITHRGLSGPAILQISSYWQPGTSIQLDLAPAIKVTQSLLAEPHRDLTAIKAALREVLPVRFIDRWLAQYSPQNWTNAGLVAFEQQLHNWTITPAGTEGYPKAEVTAGGVDTNCLDARTMQSKKVPGLYFIGEVVDVTGWLGGYNFQWAWASAHAAATSL